MIGASSSDYCRSLWTSLPLFSLLDLRLAAASPFHSHTITPLAPPQLPLPPFFLDVSLFHSSEFRPAGTYKPRHSLQSSAKDLLSARPWLDRNGYNTDIHKETLNTTETAQRYGSLQMEDWSKAESTTALTDIYIYKRSCAASTPLSTRTPHPPASG